MAVDTQNKRRSVIANLPVPDGAVSAADRIQTTWWYSGIDADAPAVVTPIVSGTSRDRFFNSATGHDRDFGIATGRDRLFNSGTGEDR